MRADQLTLQPASTPVDNARPRFGGVLWQLARRTSALAMPLAGTRWFPAFGLVVHRGRRSGIERRTPVAVRRSGNGFVLALAFGTQVDWYRNLVAAGGGRIRWRGRGYPVGAPAIVDRETAIAAFHPIQRLFLRLGGIDGFIVVREPGMDR